jgi:hypothetical protein
MEEWTQSEIHKMWEDGDVEGLLQVLEHSNDKHVLKLAILALGELKDPRAHVLLYILTECSVSPACGAHALCYKGDESALGALFPIPL